MRTLGIDIGGTRIKAGMVDDSGAVVNSAAIKTPAILAEFQEAVDWLVTGLVEGDTIPSTVGVGCKGIIDSQTTTVTTLPGTLHYLEGMKLDGLIAPLFPGGVRVLADNDARAALAGEIVWGAARGRSNVLMLTLGTGVGGAVLAEGKLLRGARGAGGHLGHFTVDPAGPLCICGNRGCLETYFSARAIETEAIGAVLRGCNSKLRVQYYDRIQQVQCRAVFDLAQEGDAVARDIRDRAIAKLAGALAGFLFTFDPEIVIVGGQIAEAGVSLFEPLARQVHERTRALLGREVPIVAPAVPDTTGVTGAAALPRLQ